MGGSGDSSDHGLRRLFEEFTSQEGQIFDNEGRQWILWKTTDLYAWWHAFEMKSETPLGRKLMNACADEEEHLLARSDILSIGKFRRRTRQKKVLASRWEQFGWGSLDVEGNAAETILHAPIAAGFALAAKELISSSRQKMEWNQVGQRSLQFRWTEDNAELPPASTPPELAWGSHGQIGFGTAPVLSELEWMNSGWSLGGEPFCFLPMGLFTRLLHTCRAYKHTLDRETTQAWKLEDMSESDGSVFLMVTSSMNALLAGTERPIYIENHSNWDALIRHYLAPFGWGVPVEIHALESLHGIRFILPNVSSLPFLTGWLVAMWERAHGNTSKFLLNREGKNWCLVIDSRHEYR
jgi:hypothetical protein